MHLIKMYIYNNIWNAQTDVEHTSSAWNTWETFFTDCASVSCITTGNKTWVTVSVPPDVVDCIEHTYDTVVSILMTASSIYVLRVKKGFF